MKEIYKFLNNSNNYIKKHHFNEKNIKKIFVTSKEKIDIEVKEYIEINKSIEYKIIPYLNL